MTSAIQMRILLDDADHMNHWIAVDDSGRAMTRIISRERVALMVSFDGRSVAIKDPLGLGNECADAAKKMC
jgi:hypothetical protein